jgi:hypothetical protein
MGKKESAEEAVRNTWRKTRRRFSAEQQIRIDRDAKRASAVVEPPD